MNLFDAAERDVLSVFWAQDQITDKDLDHVIYNVWPLRWKLARLLPFSFRDWICQRLEKKGLLVRKTWRGYQARRPGEEREGEPKPDGKMRVYTITEAGREMLKRRRDEQMP